MPIDLNAVEFAHPVPEQNSMSTFDCSRRPRDTSWRQIGIVTVADERFTLFWRHTTIIADQAPFRVLIKARQLAANVDPGTLPQPADTVK